VFFVDANVIVYAASRTRYKRGSVTVLNAVARGASGVTSILALEEVWHLERSGRIPELNGTARDAHQLFRPTVPVTDSVLDAALDLDLKGLGTADLIHVATCHEAGITDIVTADRAFDDAPGIRRVDPVDELELDRLLAG
jgi:predicted nucleic acid-binding protein